MMKTITCSIGHRRSMPYLLGFFALIFTAIFPAKTFSQAACFLAAAEACAEDDSAIVVILNAADEFSISAEDFLGALPADCEEGDFMIALRNMSSSGDTLISDASDVAGVFSAENACLYTGLNLRAELMHLDGGNMNPVCEKQVIILPEITCTNTTLYCNHPVFESTLDTSVLPLQFGCEDFDVSTLDIQIIHQRWEDDAIMDTLFRIWEVSANNGKGVVTCIDTIVREAIPIADIIFPDDTIISCENWNGSAPDPLVSGRPYFVTGGDTVFLDAGQVVHCANVTYTDVEGGPLDCSKQRYTRTWKVESASGVANGTQEIEIRDTLPPLGEFRFTPFDSTQTIIAGGETITVPIYRISTGAHDCKSDGTLPVLYTSDDCSGVHSVNVSVVVDGVERSLSNGGPFMGFKEGKYIVKYTVADSCWNMADYYVGIQVSDRINPVIALSSEHNITLSGHPITWLNLNEFAQHHITDNCGLQMIVGRRISGHDSACGAADSLSVVSNYREGYRAWLDGRNCSELVDVDDGWMDKIPFCCADLGSKIEIEVLAIDKSCNVSRGVTIVVPIDRGVVNISERLPDVTLSCDAWNQHYADLIYGDTLAGNLNVDSLDKYFGTYIPFEPGSSISNDRITIQDMDCYETMGTVFKEDITFDIYNGLFQTVCSDDLTQEVEFVRDNGCNTFTIIRRFLINGNEIARQKITTEIRCPFALESFDYPSRQDTMITIRDKSILTNPDYWTGNRFNVTTQGPTYSGTDCRVVAIGYVDKLLDSMYSSNPNEADAIIMRMWCMADWCTSDIGPDWKSSIGNDGIIVWKQYIKIFVDPINPDIATPAPGDDEGVVIAPPVVKDVFEVKGRIRTEDALNVNNVKVDIRTPDQQQEHLTNESGSFEMVVQKGASVQITPDKNDDIRNGLSTMDLIMIQRHLLGKQSLTSPYQLIAADANNDKRLTPADVLFLRRIILGKLDGLDISSSWKFVDANYTFANKKAAYAEDYPTAKDIRFVEKDMVSDFIGVKLGDVNHSVNVTRSSSRSVHDMKALSIENATLQPGDVVSIPVRMTEDMIVQGMQFALNYPAGALDVLGVSSTSIRLGQDEYAVADGEVRLSWFDVEGAALKQGEAFFTIEVKAREKISLKDVFSIRPVEVQPELYDVTDAVYSVGLTFDPSTNIFEVHQNRPNPALGQTTISYLTDRNADVKLSVHDLNGKLIYADEAQAIRGLNEFSVNVDQLSAGVLYYTITDGIQRTTRKMVVIK